MTGTRFTRRGLLAGGAAMLAAPYVARPALAQARVLRWGDVLAASHVSVQMAERVAAAVTEKTSGRVTIQVFPGGQLGGSRDMVEATAAGGQQLVTEGAAQLGAWLPAVSIIEAPYIWRDAAHMARAMNSSLIADYNRTLVERRGLRIIGVTYYGKRHLTTRDREVRTPADMQGFKLRVPEVDTFRAMAEAWGARPTPMNFNELYLALSQGAVDGQENPLPTIQSGRFNEVQRFLVLTGHVITPRLVIANDAALKALSAADQETVAQELRGAIAWHDAELASQEQALVGTFRTGGMTIVEPDVESFRRAVMATVPQRFESRWGAGTFARIEAM